jgi:hypothetical protein
MTASEQLNIVFYARNSDSVIKQASRTRLAQRLMSMSPGGLKKISPVAADIRESGAGTIELGDILRYISNRDAVVGAARQNMKGPRYELSSLNNWNEVPGTFDALARKKPGEVLRKSTDKSTRKTFEW